MSQDTAITAPERPTAPVVVETFDRWAPDLTTPALASICMRTEAAPR